MTDEHRADAAILTVTPVLLLEDLARAVTGDAQHEARPEVVKDIEGNPRIEPAIRSRKATRCLSTLIFSAVHEACDLKELDKAFALLLAAEAAIHQTEPSSSAGRGRSMDKLVAAHHRIWHLRHGMECSLQDPFSALQ